MPPDIGPFLQSYFSSLQPFNPTAAGVNPPSVDTIRQIPPNFLQTLVQHYNIPWQTAMRVFPQLMRRVVNPNVFLPFVFPTNMLQQIAPPPPQG